MHYRHVALFAATTLLLTASFAQEDANSGDASKSLDKSQHANEVDIDRQSVIKGNKDSCELSGDLYFDVGSITLSKDCIEMLKAKLAPILVKEKVYLKIVGCARRNENNPDARENVEYSNLELGMHRALYVAKVLVDAGVEESMIHIESTGSAHPSFSANSSKMKSKGFVEIYVKWSPFVEYSRDKDK